MDRVAEIRKYIEWTEEQILAGNASPTVEQYEEALRVTDLEDRMGEIHNLAANNVPNDKGGYLKPEERLALIADLSEASA